MLTFSFLKSRSMNFFSSFLFCKENERSSKKKQTFDLEGEAIISEFVNAADNTILALQRTGK